MRSLVFISNHRKGVFMFFFIRPLVVAAGLALCICAQAAKPAKPASAPIATGDTELAHNLGTLGETRLQAVVDRYNKENGGSMKLIRFEKGQKPAALNLVIRYDMADVLIQPKKFLPLHDMMAKAGQALNVGELSADLKAGVLDAKGRLVALPLVYSTPVLFFDKNALRKAKLDPEQPPRTWFEMQGMLDKLQTAGYACPYTSSWPVWVHIDNVSSLSGVPVMNAKGQLSFNGLPQVKHVAMLATWAKAGYFQNFGRRDEASVKFRNGECAMITTDSREAVDFRDASGVDLGVALLPFHEDIYGGRQHTLADGASLWAGAGHSSTNYKQAASFVAWLLTPEMQAELVHSYGSLPLTAAARAAAKSKLLKSEDQTLQLAYQSIDGKGAQPGVRVANIDPLRIVADEELEAVWANRKPAKSALDTAVSRGNAVLAAKPGLKKAQPF